MKVLNLYAGIGGNRKLWTDVEVTAVELNPKIAKIYQDSFPQDKVIVVDAHWYLLEHIRDNWDFIWSSPPCPSHSVCSHFLKGQGIIRYPDQSLWQEIILLKHFFKGKYCVENVVSYYEPLYPPQRVGRHYFWANFFISPIKLKHQIGTFNRQARKERQNKALKNQLERNAVLPELGLHILNESKRDIQAELFR